MDRKVRRRDFLNRARAAAGLLAYAPEGPAAANAASKTKAKAVEVMISGSKYTPATCSWPNSIAVSTTRISFAGKRPAGKGESGHAGDAHRALDDP
jgi:hypothetical protein